MKFDRRTVAATGLIALLGAGTFGTAAAELSPVCQEAFESTDAIPGTPSCTFDALLFTPTLANYTCGTQDISEYCATLPEGGDGGPDDGGPDDGGPDDGGPDDGGPDDGGPDDGGPDDGGADEAGSDDGSGELEVYEGDDVEVIVGGGGTDAGSSDDDGAGTPTIDLEPYDGNSAGGGNGGSGSCSGGTSTSSSARGVLTFVFGPGLNFARGVLSNVPLVGSLFDAASLIEADRVAEETGNPTPVYQAGCAISTFGFLDEICGSLADFTPPGGWDTDC